MSFNVDKYLGKRFRQGRYNCFDFAKEVWLELSGQNINFNPSQDEKDHGQQALDIAATLTPLSQPESPCLVLLMSTRIEPHVGVYYNGRVLHLNQMGAYYMPLDHVTRGYPTVSYYK